MFARIDGGLLTQNFILFLTNLGYIIFRMDRNLHRTVFRFVTIHAFDRRTDSFLVASPRRRSMQRGKNVKLRQMGA